MLEQLPLPSAGHSAGDYRTLRAALNQTLEKESARIRETGELDLNRAALRHVFDDNGFGGEYFGLNFGLPVGELLPALEHVHRDILVDLELLAEAYPDGSVDLAAVDLDQGFLPGPSSHTPILAADLLAQLGVAAAPVEEQRQAIAAWCSENRPNRLLEDDLRAHGLL